MEMAETEDMTGIEDMIAVEIITKMAVMTDGARKEEPHKHGYYL